MSSLLLSRVSFAVIAIQHFPEQDGKNSSHNHLVFARLNSAREKLTLSRVEREHLLSAVLDCDSEEISSNESSDSSFSGGGEIGSAGANRSHVQRLKKKQRTESKSPTSASASVPAAGAANATTEPAPISNEDVNKSNAGAEDSDSGSHSSNATARIKKLSARQRHPLRVAGVKKPSQLLATVSSSAGTSPASAATTSRTDGRGLSAREKTALLNEKTCDTSPWDPETSKRTGIVLTEAQERKLIVKLREKTDRIFELLRTDREIIPATVPENAIEKIFLTHAFDKSLKLARRELNRVSLRQSVPGV